MSEEAVHQGEETTTQTVQTDANITPDEVATQTAEAGAAAETGQTSEATEDTHTELSSLSEFTGYLKEVSPDLELDEDTILGLHYTTKVNGEETEITLRDAIKNMSKGMAGSDRLSQAKEKSRGLMEEATQARQAAQTELQLAQGLVTEMEKSLNREVDAADLKTLRTTDPEKYLIRKEEIRERQEQIKNFKQQVQQTLQKTAEEQNRMLEAALAEAIPKEQEKLVKAIPELGDETTGEQLKKEIIESLSERGFTPDELSQAYDSRLIIMAHDAMQYRKGQQKKSAARKKVIKVPKVAKPGNSKSAAGSSDKPRDVVDIMYGSS